MFLILFCLLFFCTGFLGFFESKEEKAIKNLIDIYFSTPVSQLSTINLTNYPKDIQVSFKDLIKYQYKLSQCVPQSSLGEAWDLWTRIVNGVMNEGDLTAQSEYCIQDYQPKVESARYNFISACKKYGVDKSYFQKAAKKARR